LRSFSSRATCRRFLEEVKRYKFRGSSGKVNLALDALPELKSMPGDGHIYAEQFPFRRALNTWSAGTTTRNTGTFRADRTLTW